MVALGSAKVGGVYIFYTPDLAVLMGNERFDRLILENGGKKGSVIEN